MEPKLPIGIFDSGIGGITVLKVLRQHFPQENFLYVGDTARLPYGTKSPQTIRIYAEQIMNYLVDTGVKAIVIACNTASSQVPEDQWRGVPVFSTIGPGAEQALAHSQSKRIGVIGTRATIESETYPREITKLDPSAQVWSVASPLLVPLAEEGLDSDPITNLIVSRYCGSLLAHDIDTLILGCTHYPLLKQSFQRVCGSSVTLVDSGEAIALRMEKQLGLQSAMSQKQDIAPTESNQGGIEICLTDYPQHHEKMIQKVLGVTGPISSQHIHLTL
jgi:glutamate racemase